MEENLIEPLKDFNPDEFPYSEEKPLGCNEIDLKDTYGYQVDLKETDYCVRHTEQEDVPLKMLVYMPKSNDEKQKFPMIVYCQGSAFHKQWLFDHMRQHVRMAARGYVIFVLEYRPSEVAPFPAQTVDCKTAIRFAKQHADEYHGDVNHIALWGDSSGGHTVVMSGVTGDRLFNAEDDPDVSCQVNAVVDWYGPMDFSKMNLYPSSQNHYDADSPEGFEIGQVNVLENMDRNNQASPLTYIHPDTDIPPVLIMHGGRDMLVPFNQSVRLYEKLKENGKEAVFYKLKNGNHGFNGFNCEEALDLVDEFLQKHI